jgi:hypothetical protein
MSAAIDAVDRELTHAGAPEIEDVVTKASPRPIGAQLFVWRDYAAGFFTAVIWILLTL